MSYNSKMWEGRFKKPLDSKVNDFNSSIKFDWVMFKEDINGSIAHAYMLGETGIIEKSEAEKIIDRLEKILQDIESGSLEIDCKAEDIHMFVEQILTERIGDTGKKLHTARSRNDQVALDIRMYLKKQCGEVSDLLKNLIYAVIEKAEENKNTLMPGVTHLQHGQPIVFAHHILAYAQMFKRDIERIADAEKRMDYMPLGSGALAGTTYPIDRHMVAEKLGFANVTENSIDGVSDRDFVIELASDLSIIMTHISRFSEEIILWCTSEYNFIELDDAFSTGSSIMPQKKNPDVAELCRGKAGRVYGSLMTLLTVMKALPLAYNKDMQEDKEAIFDALENTKLSLDTFTGMLRTLKVNRDSMKKATSKGFLNATDCADYLVKKGLPFRDAYKITGQLVAMCIEKNLTLEDLPLDEYKKICNKFENDVYKYIDLEYCVNERKVYGGPSAESIDRQIKNLEEFLKNN
ncbi:MAG: argininosuccinate lyase [Oscillospiraceae bacterium]|nr:argininosuccinate lyase [Oscillospiraceae bacterium]